MKLSIRKPIVLVGMMGSGKSTIGKRLAYKLNMQFYDSDKMIEEREGLSVLDIFDYRGEEYFRSQEMKVISEVLNYGSVVLSTGGETFIDDEIRKIIKEKAIVVWLKTNIDTIHERVSRRNTRPKLTGENVRDTIEKMLAEAEPKYAEADIMVESKDMEAHFVIDTILSRLKNLTDKIA